MSSSRWGKRALCWQRGGPTLLQLAAALMSLLLLPIHPPLDAIWNQLCQSLLHRFLSPPITPSSAPSTRKISSLLGLVVMTSLLFELVDTGYQSRPTRGWLSHVPLRELEACFSRICKANHLSSDVASIRAYSRSIEKEKKLSIHLPPTGLLHVSRVTN